MAQTGKRREYFLQQGYSSVLIGVLESCGITKHMLWFLNQLKGLDGKVATQDFKSHLGFINKHIESKTKNNFKTLEEAYKSACLASAKKNSLLKKALYTFKDGYSVLLLEPTDLYAEGINMANCVGGYMGRLSSKERALMALKNPEGNTVVHFEIMKNGMLSQNFEKANMPVRQKYWKYISEFLKNNSKNIQSSKHLGFAWDAHMRFDSSGIHLSAECLLPKRISKFVNSRGEIDTAIEHHSSLKRFEVNIPKIKMTEFNKDTFVRKLKESKDNFIKSIDDIIQSVEMTDGENMYVSDKLKERIFGDGHYLMKGDGYSALDLTMFENQNLHGEMIEAIPDEMPMEGAEVPMMERAEVRGVHINQHIGRVERPMREEPVVIPAIRDEELHVRGVEPVDIQDDGLINVEHRNVDRGMIHARIAGLGNPAPREDQGVVDAIFEPMNDENGDYIVENVRRPAEPVPVRDVNARGY